MIGPTMRVTLFVPCFMDQLFPSAGMAMVHVLERLGHRVDFRENVICCGQPPFNAGYWNEARPIAETLIRGLLDSEAVVVGSGSCASMVRVFNPDLFAGTLLEPTARELAGKTFEFSQFLVDRLGVTDVGARFDATVTFHDGCHGLRELRVKRQPRVLLNHVRGLKLIEMDEAETCCGFGGTFAVKFEPISVGMGQNKCNSARATSADYLVSNDSSCLMHIGGLADKSGQPIRTLHLAEVLAKT